MGKILKYFDLIRYFPTEESKYSAYKDFLGFAITIPLTLASIHELPKWLQILSGIYIFIGAFVVPYVFIYLFVKSGIFKIVGKLIVLSILSLLICFLFPPFFIIFPILGIIFNSKRRHILEQYYHYVKYLIYPYLLGAIALLLTVALTIAGITIIRREDEAAIFFMGIIGCLIILGLPMYYYLKLLNVEQQRGVPFLKMYKLTWIIPMTYSLMISSAINLLSWDFVNGDILIDDISDCIDANEDVVVNTSTTITTPTNIENTDLNTTANETNIDIDNYENINNLSVDINSLNSLNFNNFIFNTPMHVEAFQENPYTLFALNTPENGTALDFCSNDGLPQLHIAADGQMLNSELSPIGKIVYGDNGTMTMFNNNNIEMASVDNHGFVKSGDYILGKVQNNGDLRTFTDFQNNESSYVQNGTIWANGKMVGQIKKV